MKNLLLKLFVISTIIVVFTCHSSANGQTIIPNINNGTEAPGSGQSGTIGMTCSGTSVAGEIVSVDFTNCTIVIQLYAAIQKTGNLHVYNVKAKTGTYMTIPVPCWEIKYMGAGGHYAHCF